MLSELTLSKNRKLMKLKPIHQSPTLKIFSVSTETELELPMVGGIVASGFPSPANDFLDKKIDLNKYLIQHPSTTFIAQTNGNSMIGAGISDKDLLIIDRALEPSDGKIAVCLIDNEFTLKRLQVKKDGIYLVPENPAEKTIKVTEHNNFEIWGMLTFSIQKHF